MPPGSDRATTANRLLETSARLFYERGYHATNLREIAAEVGIRAPSVYNHFLAKEDLLFAIAKETMEELLHSGTRAVEGIDDPGDRLRALVEQHVVFHCRRRFEAKVADDQLHALSPDRRAQVIAVRDAYEHLFRDAIVEGTILGWSVQDVPLTTFAITTMASSVVDWYRDDGRLSAEQIAKMYADLAVSAVGAQER
jgi:AcrR family transcriptional regulator